MIRTSDSIGRPNLDHGTIAHAGIEWDVVV